MQYLKMFSYLIIIKLLLTVCKLVDLLITREILFKINDKVFKYYSIIKNFLHKECCIFNTENTSKMNINSKNNINIYKKYVKRYVKIVIVYIS